jgi:aspartyl-tRNA synthetase
MSFATSADVMDRIENLIRRLWSSLLAQSDLPSPFPRLSYQSAMSTYGSDKPDTRLGMQIHAIDHLIPAQLISNLTSTPSPTVEAFKIQISSDARETRRFTLSFMSSPEGKSFETNPDGAPGVFVVDPRQPLQGLSPLGFEGAEHVEELLQLEEGDLIVLQARKKGPHTGGSTALGNLRVALHKAAVAAGYIDPPEGFNFLWVTDFPLFSPTNDVDPGQGGAAGLSSTHHPFTAPKTAEDVDKLLTAPLEVQADHYDLVVNGVELGGGSRRIHDARVQEYILKDVLKVCLSARRHDGRHQIFLTRDA